MRARTSSALSIQQGVRVILGHRSFCATLAALASASAVAQSLTTAPSDSSVEEAGGGLDEVVVTAQRRVETIQKSSLAIQVLGGDQLVTGGVTQAKDLNRLVPGLQLAQGGTATQIFIRGVGDFSASLLANPGVAFNLDGVCIARPQAIGTNFYDVDRIEVLKGPQGTLYGRNASGGAINLITRKPVLSGLSGYAMVEGGSYSLKHGAGAVNLPIGPQLALRAAFDVVDRDGYLTDGTDDDKHEAGRAHLLWQPSENLSVLSTFDYAHVHGSGPGYALSARLPGSSEFLGSGDPRAIAILAMQAPLGSLIAFGAPPIANGFSNFQPRVDNTSWSFATELHYDMGWSTLTILPAWRDFRDNESNYPGFSNAQIFHSQTFTTEVRLNGDRETLHWVAGLFYFTEDQSGRTHIDQGVPQLSDASFPTSRADSYAGFGQASYSVRNDLRIIGGARYTVDYRALAGSISTLSFLTPPVHVGPFAGTQKFYSTTWKAGVEYDVTDANMLFFTVSTGYKAGGINQEPAPNTYAPEKLKAYELGSRNRFFDERLQVNLELFKWDYQDHQEAVVTFDNTFAPNFLVRNAGKASLKGASLDVQAKITRSDTLRGYVEYNDARYDSFVVDAAAFALTPGVSTGCPVGPSARGPAFVSIDCSGFQLARAPRWTASASWDHGFHLPNGALLMASASGSYNSWRWGSVDFTDNARLPSDLTGNFDLTYTGATGNWSFTGFVHNVSDKRAASGAALQVFQPTAAYWTIGPPRTYGARVFVNF